jgi:hypothetical protein
MTPKEKANELFEKYYQVNKNHDFDFAKDCALIAVFELLKDTEEIDGMRVINNPYWLEVKQEIEKL